MSLTYGNYLGNGHNNYPEQPIDDLDICCYMHDIDHKISGGNNYFADRTLGLRLSKIDSSTLSFKGQIWLFLAKYVYVGLYTILLRTISVLDDESKYLHWKHTMSLRQRTYMQDANIWPKDIQDKIELFLDEDI